MVFNYYFFDQFKKVIAAKTIIKSRLLVFRKGTRIYVDSVIRCFFILNLFLLIYKLNSGEFHTNLHQFSTNYRTAEITLIMPAAF